MIHIICLYKHERMKNTGEANKVQTDLKKHGICQLYFAFFML